MVDRSPNLFQGLSLIFIGAWVGETDKEISGT